MIELNQILLKNAAGKIIKKVIIDIEGIAIRYSDDTFTFFQEYTDNIITMKKLIDSHGSYLGRLLLSPIIELELISHEEFNSLPEIKSKNKKIKEKKEEEEKVMLQKLKEKYKD